VRILVVDDDRAVRDALRRALTLAGYEVQAVDDGEQALEQISQSLPDAVVLDIGMPGIDGLEVCRHVRRLGNRVPILMLTARDAVEDRVEGLDAGADDYLVKPFALTELLARVRALLRRGGDVAESEATTLLFADVTLDLVAMTAKRGDRELELTRTEFLLLELFLRNPDRVLTREVIMDRVWGMDARTSSNGVEVYVGYLRKKLEAGGEPRLVHTVRGFGYALREK